MMVDKRIIEWKRSMMNVMFSNFKDYKEVGNVLIVARIINDKLEHFIFQINDINTGALKFDIPNIIHSLSSDAYIVIMNHDMVLRPTSELEQIKREYNKVGSVDKMKDSKDVVVFTYENRIISQVSVYEIIRTDDDAVMNKSAIMDAMDIKQDVFFTGILNVDRHTKMLQLIN